MSMDLKPSSHPKKTSSREEEDKGLVETVVLVGMLTQLSSGNEGELEWDQISRLDYHQCEAITRGCSVAGAEYDLLAMVEVMRSDMGSWDHPKSDVLRVVDEFCLVRHLDEGPEKDRNPAQEDGRRKVFWYLRWWLAVTFEICETSIWRPCQWI